MPFRTVRRLMFLLLALTVTWRTVRYALNFPLWGDEAFLAMSLLVRDFRGMIQPLEYGQIAPLGFMWACLAAKSLLGIEEWALRLVPYLVGLASAWLFWRLARSTLGVRSGLLAMGVFAAAYFPMRYGVELKPYGMDMLVSTGVFYLAWRIVSKTDGSNATNGTYAHWAALTVVAALGVWCSYPSVFVSGGAGLVLAAWLWQSGRRREWTGWAGYSGAVAVSFAAMFLLYARPHAAAATWLEEIPMWRETFPPVEQPWRLPLWFLDTHAGEMLAYPVGGKHGGSAIPLLLAILGGIALWRTGRWWLLALLLSPLPLAFLAATLHRYPYSGGIRVTLYMAPAFCLLIGRGAAAALAMLAPRRRAGLALASSVALLVTILLAGMVRDIVRPYKGWADAENRQVMANLVRSALPNTHLAVFNSLGETPFAPNLGAWGGSGARFRYYITLLAREPAQWAPPPTELATKDTRIRLLVYRDNKAPFPEELLSNYTSAIAGRHALLERRAFPLGGAEVIEAYDFDLPAGAK